VLVSVFSVLLRLVLVVLEQIRQGGAVALGLLAVILAPRQAIGLAALLGLADLGLLPDLASSALSFGLTALSWRRVMRMSSSPSTFSPLAKPWLMSRATSTLLLSPTAPRTVRLGPKRGRSDKGYVSSR
jgi:hypothetical protein